ncbi:hypothetical protein [Psychrobacter sp. WY6]|uniref:hypothetical protein n=1 Tax=Psychrobacter sp. WY6 TaxID=2708350 RepID=UPI002022B914|nr:hypothetical protein [Psychrobacter sp. WY6]
MSILLFGALRWLLDIYLDVLPLKEGYWDFGIPLLLSVSVVSICMWPRYELLTLKWVKRSSSGYFFITMVLALVIPLVLSQNYLSKAAYEVIEVDSLSDIRYYPKQKYFRVDNFEPLKLKSVSYIETQVVSGRYFDSKLHIDYYIATPFTAADNIWLGTTTRNTIIVQTKVLKTINTQRLLTTRAISTKPKTSLLSATLRNLNHQIREVVTYTRFLRLIGNLICHP